jgi:hypothetical protein
MREMHGCHGQAQIKPIAKNVDVSSKRTAWGCGICSALLLDWEERCEHVAKHCEAGSSRQDWTHSKVIIGLLRQPMFDCAWRTYLIERHGNYPDSTFGFCWRTSSTGRSSHCDRRLQDWLEMGHTDRDVDFIIDLAYKHGYRSVKNLLPANNASNGSTPDSSTSSPNQLSDRFSALQFSDDTEGCILDSSVETDDSDVDDENQDGKATFSSSVSDDLSMDDPCAALSHLICHAEEKIVDKLMCEVESLLNQDFGYTEHGGDAQELQSHGASPSASFAAQTNSTLPRKRQRHSSRNSRYSEGSDEDDDGDCNKRPNPVSKSSQGLGPRFACPYYQRNPNKHKARSCAGPGWISVHRVK